MQDVEPPAIAQRVDALPEDARLCMSFVTWAELLKGAERSTRKPEVLRRLEALARQVAVLYPAGPAICEHYAEQFTRLKDAGTPIVVAAPESEHAKIYKEIAARVWRKTEESAGASAARAPRIVIQ